MKKLDCYGPMALEMLSQAICSSPDPRRLHRLHWGSKILALSFTVHIMAIT